MLVLPQTITIKWHNTTKKHYESKGYKFTGVGEEFIINVLDLPNGSGTRVKFKCDNCGKMYEKAYQERSSNNVDYCYNCRGVLVSKEKTKYTFEDVKREFENRNFTLLENEYLGYEKKHRYLCENGHEATITFKSLLKGNGCNKCAVINRSNKQRKNIEEVKEIFEREGCILLSSKYKNSRQKLKYICICGNIDEKDLIHFQRGQRCIECGLKRLREVNLKYNIDIAKEIFANQGCVLLEEEYRDSTAPMRYICECGTESKISLVSFMRGTRCRDCGNKKISETLKNPNITDEERLLKRNYPEYVQWRHLVYERDDYTCVVCGDNMGGNLNAHHLNSYHWCKSLRTEVSNGVTLCDDCHLDFHKQFGYTDNDVYQFLKWFNSKTDKKFNINLLGDSTDESLFYYANIKEVKL